MIPASGNPESGTATPANLGTWDVKDNGTDLGNLGEMVGTGPGTGTSAESNATGFVSLTGTGSFSSLNGLSSTNTDWVRPGDYMASSLYQTDIAKGEAFNDATGPDPLGDVTVQITKAENSSFQGEGTLYQLGQTATSTTPSQVLVARHGGGPLAIMGSKKAAIAPLIVFLIGAAFSVTGVVAANFCGKSNGCLGMSKNVWAAIGGILQVAGGVLMGLAYAPGLFTTAVAGVAGAGEVAMGVVEASEAASVGSSISSLSESAFVAAEELVFAETAVFGAA